MRPVESLAKRLLESLLPGARLQYQDDQSTSIPDFDLFHAGVKHGVVEVTSSADRAIIESTAALRNTGASAIQRDLCKRDWLLFPNREAKIRRFPSSVDAYLSAIESDGLERFSRINCDYPSVLRMWRDLRIEGGFVLQTKKPGFIYVSRAGQGCSPVGTSVAVDAALAVASKKDNCDKLASSGSGKPPLGCAHRHFKQPRLDLTSRL
jgi:hypothetical protein